MPLNVDLLNTGCLLVNGSPILNLYETGSGLCSTQRAGVNNEANGDCSVISGGERNTIGAITTSSGYYVFGSTIGGGSCNTISSYSGSYDSFGNTIAGGFRNVTVSSCYNGQTIGGGYRNTSIGSYSTVSGGANNTSSGGYSSTVGGGRSNTSSNYYSTIGGGGFNTSSGYASTVSGGYRNTSIGSYSTVSGGYRNTTINGCSAILGGQCNTVQHDCSFIVGSGIFSTAANTTHVNCLHISNIPTSSAGLAPGTVWRNGTVLEIIP